MPSIFDIDPGPAVGLIVVGLVVVAVAMGAKFTGQFKFEPNLSRLAKYALTTAGAGLVLLGVLSLVTGPSSESDSQAVASPMAAPGTEVETGDSVSSPSNTPADPIITTSASTTTTLTSTTPPTSATTIATNPRSCFFDPIKTGGNIEGSAVITSLVDGQVFSQKRDGAIIGTEWGVPLSVDIWIVNTPKGSNLVYPQSHSEDSGPAVRSAGKFSSASYITTEGKHEIIVLLAEAAASDVFRETLLEWQSTGNYVGMPREGLPAGVVETDCVTVTFEGE